MRIEALTSIPKKYTSAKETARKKATEILINKIHKIWPIEVRGEENFETARQHLKQGALFIVFPHSFSGDVFCGGAIFLEKFGDDLKHLILPAGKKHVHFTRALGSFVLGELWPRANLTRNEAFKIMRDALVIRAVAKVLGAERIDIVQGYQSELDFYGLKQAAATWKRLLNRFQEIQSEPGIVIPYAPEGHRHYHLQKARRGIATLLERAGENCLCLPLGIYLAKNTEDIGLNQGEPVIVNAGPLFGLKDLTDCQQRPLSKEEKIQVADRLMERLAQLLPPDRRGAYTQDTAY